MARSSLGLALSAFRTAGEDLLDKGANVQAYLGELGFSKLSLGEYDLQPNIRTIASALGMKTIMDKEESVTILAVAISGGGYKDEWQSNFLMGAGVHHEGFHQAAQTVYQRVHDYIKQEGITGRVKLWIAGYSRAAAVSNRLAAMVLDNRMVLPQDLYAYTFATPNVTRYEQAGTYPSIFNIVGAFDPVPLIPFDDWGYTRFGSTYYLPSPETNSDYQMRVLPVSVAYLHLTGQVYQTTASGNRLMEQVVSMFSGSMPQAESYTRDVQPFLISLWQNRKNPMAMLVQTATAYVASDSLRKQINNLADQTWAIFSGVKPDSLLTRTNIKRDNYSPQEVQVLESLLHEHYPQRYVAWLMAYDNLPAMSSTNRKYRLILVDNGVEIVIKDQQGRQALGLVWDEQGQPRQVLPSYLPAETLSQGQVLITLPQDQDYQVFFGPEGPGAEPFDLRIQEGQTGFTRKISFGPELVSLPLGQTAHLSLPIQPATDGQYALTWQGGSQLLAQNQQTGEQDSNQTDHGFRNLIAQNALTLGSAVLLLLLQSLLYVWLAVGAYRRRRLAKRQFRKQGTAMPLALHAQEMVPTATTRSIKALALPVLLLISGVVLAVSSLILRFSWQQADSYITQPLLRRFAAIFNLPFVVMLLLSALPAIIGSLAILLLRTKGRGNRKACQLYATLAVLNTLVLVAFSLYHQLNAIAQMNNWLIAVAMLQVGLLVVLLIGMLKKRPACKGHAGDGEKTKDSASNHTS